MFTNMNCFISTAKIEMQLNFKQNLIEFYYEFKIGNGTNNFIKNSILLIYKFDNSQLHQDFEFDS